MAQRIPLNERQHSLDEWARMKPIIYNLYMAQNKSNEEVVNDLRTLYNFEVSKRQLKSKFHTWNWPKKVNNSLLFFAMDKVVREHGSGVSFEIQLEKDQAPKKKTAAVITKETKRKVLALQKQNKAVPQIPTLDDAYRILDSGNVQVKGIFMPTYQYFHAPAIRQPMQPPAYVNDPSADHDPIGLSDDESTTSTDSLSDREMEQMEFRGGLNNQELARPWDAPDSWAHVRQPHPTGSNAWAYVLSRDMPPQTAATRTLDNVALPVHIYPLAEPPHFSPANNASDDLTVQLTTMSLSLDPRNTQRAFWEKFLGIKLAEHYRRFDLGQTQSPLIEFAAYYILQCLAGYKTLDQYDNPQRVDARQKLTSMLQTGNPHLLPAIYWVVTVLGSNDVRQQLKEFFEDCSECVDKCPSSESRIIRPYIMIGLSLLEKTINQKASESNEAMESIKDLMQKSELKAQLEETLTHLRTTNQGQSANFVIIQGTYAWYFEKTGDHNQSLRLLTGQDGLPLIERIMGPNHLVTCTYMAMASRCYEQTENMELAINYLEIALARLANCAYPLRAYKHRLQQQLAKLYESLGQLNLAVFGLQTVLDFRLETLGPCSGATWETAYMLFGALEKQGRGVEARQRREELMTLYERSSTT